MVCMSENKNKYYHLYKNLGNNIKKFRKKHNISQEELAFRISSARNYIGCIERAEKAPSLGIIFAIADTLNIKVENLFHENE